jgi:uncharacterized membrane protein
MKKKMDLRTASKLAMGLGFIITGLALNSLGISGSGFGGFETAGSYLIYVGFIAMLLGGLAMFSKKKLVDERMMFISSKAMRLTFMAFMVFAFAVVIGDGISRITMPYHLFMSYLVCGMLLFYVAAYTILLRMG